MSLFVHIGAPRTGTSFLRKRVFPFFENTTFYNKQGLLPQEGQDVVDFFARIAHHGDGDELSISMDTTTLPVFLDSANVLISEEHFLWSVYHMMGNVGSKALLLKRYCPNAKIILTIRRQSEYYLSIFKYLKQYDNSHIRNQMRSIENMLNVFREVSGVEISRYRRLPVGVKIETRFSQFDIHKHYFNRRIRHFLSVDLSWCRIYEIYADLFGRDNIVILPQEMLDRDPYMIVTCLSRFLEQKWTGELLNANKRENASPAVSVFQAESRHVEFVEFVLSVNHSSNCKLNSVLGGDLLEQYGYCACGSVRRTSISLGIYTQERNRIAPGRRVNTLKLYWDRGVRLHCIGALLKGLIMFLSKLIRSALIQLYYRFSAAFERLQGLDLSQMVSVEDLHLQQDISEQYESTKGFELRRWLKHIPMNIRYRAIDFGSGKGTVLITLAQTKNFEKIYGLEISHVLNSIAQDNLKKKGVANVELITADARETPMEIIDNCNFFYFYNPFPAHVFEEVFNRIEISVRRKKRQAIIVYFNPIHSKIIEGSYLFLLEHRLRNLLSRTHTHIYKTKDDVVSDVCVDSWSIQS